MRITVTRLGRTAAAALIALPFAAFGALPAATTAGALSEKDIPTSMHGAVETQAVTVGNGALSLLVDPGTAYAYSTLDRDDYGNDSVSFTMTARGANVNLGTIAYAVLWAPPSCPSNIPCILSGGYDPHAPNTGLHEAKGFPGYAEALYPPPPADDGASQERVYKCVVNKDGPGSPPTGGRAEDVCKDKDFVPMTAWAETVDDEFRSTGFSRAAGFDAGLVAVRGSESFSEVRAIGEGKVRSTGYSNVSGISLLNGHISIDNVYSEATIVASEAGVDGRKSSAKCQITGLRVGKELFSEDFHQLADGRLQAALDQVAERTKLKVEILPPVKEELRQVDEGKFATGCAGMQVKITDMNTQAPVPLCSPSDPPGGAPRCVPSLGNREELSFGRISAQQSVFNFPSIDGGGVGGLPGLGGGGELPTGGGEFADVGGAGAGLGGGSADGSGSGFDTGGSGSGGGGGAGGSGVAGGGGGRAGSGDGEYAGGPIQDSFDEAKIGALTAVGGLGLIVGVLALIGVVDALATGRRFRLPGF